MAKKAAKKAAKKPAPEPTGKPDPLIRKLSEVQKMTNKEKEAFRKAGGTTIQG